MDLRSQLGVNLREISKAAYVSSLYQQPDVESEFRKFFFSLSVTKLKMYSPAFCQLKSSYQSVLHKVDEKISFLPKALQHELTRIIRAIGDQIIEWFEFILREKILSGVPVDQKYDFYGKNLYWTCHGLIDEVRIVKSWLKNPDVDLVKVFKMACLFCVEDVIYQLWDRVSDDSELGNFRRLWDQNLGHVAYWVAFLRGNLPDFVKYTGNNIWNKVLVTYQSVCHTGKLWYYSKNHSLEVNMFVYSLTKCQTLAAKYFWSKMKAGERCNVDVAFYSLKCLNDSFKIFHKKTKYMECLVFLLNQWSEMYHHSEMMEMIQTRAGFLIIMADVWPWQTSLTPIFDIVTNVYLRDAYDEYFVLFGEVLHDECLPSSMDYFSSKLYSSVFRSCAWRIVPERIRNLKLFEIFTETLGNVYAFADFIFKMVKTLEPRDCEVSLIVLSSIKTPYGVF